MCVQHAMAWPPAGSDMSVLRHTTPRAPTVSRAKCTDHYPYLHHGGRLLHERPAQLDTTLDALLLLLLG